MMCDDARHMSCSYSPSSRMTGEQSSPFGTGVCAPAHVVTRPLPTVAHGMARHGDVRSLNGSSIAVPRRGPAGPSVQKKIYLIDVTGATDVSDLAKS